MIDWLNRFYFPTKKIHYRAKLVKNYKLFPYEFSVKNCKRHERKKSINLFVCVECNCAIAKVTVCNNLLNWVCNAATKRREHFNGFSISIGCLNRTITWFTLLTGLFQRVYTFKPAKFFIIAPKMRHNGRQSDDNNKHLYLTGFDKRYLH